MSKLNTNSTVKEDNVNGWINGFIGVLIFSGSLPATRIAVFDINPVFLTVARASIAGVLALCILLLSKSPRPRRNQLMPLLVVAAGVVVGYPLLSALALQHITSAHSIVFVAMLPLSTALFAVFRGGEQPRRVFWLFSVLGFLFVMVFAAMEGISVSPVGDLLMLLAVVVCGLGYADGARLSRTLGGWQVICWALVLSLPVMLPLTLVLPTASLAEVSIQAWMGLAYVSLFSMLIGFFFWYRGLAQGGIAAVGQLQLLQPFFGLALAAVLLHEKITTGMIVCSAGVILCVAISRRFAR